MENTTISPPICAKHGCEKVWGKRRALKAGGRWICRRCKAASQKKQKDSNPDLVNAIARVHNAKWRKANPEAARATALAGSRKYRATHPEKARSEGRAQSAKRRATKRAATSPLCKVTAAAIAERFALTDGCAYCGADAKLTADHVVALNDGGLHVPPNLVGACLSCNSSKQDSPVEEWYRKQPFFSEQRWQRIQEITGNGQLSLI